MKITTQPVAQVVEEGKTATFTAAASGVPTPTVQWQVSTDAGGTWSDVLGATSDTLNVEHTTTSENGYEYQAVFTNEVSQATTTAATLTVKEKAHEVGKPKEEESEEPIVSPKPREVKIVSSLPVGSSSPSGGGGGGGVFGEQAHTPPPAPDAELASTSVMTSASGAVAIAVSCPASESSCAGTVTLRTLGAVSTRHAGKSKKKSKAVILTLAAGSFTVAGGQVETVTLQLSAKGRGLLARLHVLHAQASVVAHDPAGATHTTQTTVTLRAAKAGGRGKH